MTTGFTQSFETMQSDLFEISHKPEGDYDYVQLRCTRGLGEPDTHTFHFTKQEALLLVAGILTTINMELPE